MALIDSGVDDRHPALAGRIVAGYDFVNGDRMAEDEIGHGTGMAVILAGDGISRGLCPSCRIMPLKVAEPDGSGEWGRVTAARLAHAIDFATERRADLILIGAGFARPDPAIADAIARAESSGIPLVAPAGSVGPDRMLYPAAYPTVIPVAALEDGDRPTAALAVSGESDRTATPGGGTVARSGSSIAAARLAGAVALLLEEHADITPDWLRRLLGLPQATASDATARRPPPAVGVEPGPVSWRPDVTGDRGERAGDAGDAGDAGRLQYADRAGTDIVMDAPWKTVRDYVPVLFFFPEFGGGRRVEQIRIFECVDGEPAGPPVLVDSPAGPDTLNGVTFLGPLGEARGGLGPDDQVRDFWHYIARVPHRSLHIHGTPDVHYLYTQVEWSLPRRFGRQTIRYHRVLRVLVDPRPFPSFDPVDHYFDTHVHSIAEQTSSGALKIDGARKAFGGPLVMLLESSFALGLLQTPPSEDWSAHQDDVVVTDHNVFYSAPPYDTGTLPGFGPSAAAADGAGGEAAWYREHLGRLAGEEITLQRGPGQRGTLHPNVGHHLLAYDTRHFEGPWHGGRFLTSRLENPNTLRAVLAGMKADGPTGFAYASHPGLEGFVWPDEYFAEAIGFPPHDSLTGPQVNSTGDDFLFKGAEVWNIKADEVATGNTKLPASRAFEAINPFAGGPVNQRFVPRVWDDELTRSLAVLFEQIGRGLDHAFRERPGERFIRKIYLSAGSDAHGDFNYADEVSATAVPWSGMLHSNAYARVRTYAVVHDRPAGMRDAVDAFRDGNTVLTDGPLFLYHLDSDGRHHPAAGSARWHDAIASWEDADGSIGGQGRFDGGRTMLVPLPAADVWIRSRWMRSATPGAGSVSRLEFVRVTGSARESFEVPAGAEGAPDERYLPLPMDRLAALVATGRDTVAGERCIANPVWVAPVGITILAPTEARDALPARSVRVVFEFPISMSAGAPTRACMRPLNSMGNSTDPEIVLVPHPGWEEKDGVIAARYTVTNEAIIPLPAADWDAGTHSSVPGMRSFVVYLDGPADVHGNVLNDVGRTFAIRAGGATGSVER